MKPHATRILGAFLLLAAHDTEVATAAPESPGTANAEASTVAAGGKAAPTRAAAVGSARFERVVALNGVSFRISCPNESSLNTLVITPSGLERDNAPISREVDGTVTGAEVADLDADGSPEIYVYVQSAGSGSYGSLVAYAANKRKSLSEIHLPPVADDPQLAQGYMGHDEFAIVEGSFVQRFPLYAEGDTNSAPSGKMRQLQYKLVPGEAGWLLKLERTFDY